MKVLLVMRRNFVLDGFDTKDEGFEPNQIRWDIGGRSDQLTTARETHPSISFPSWFSLVKEPSVLSPYAKPPKYPRLNLHLTDHKRCQDCTSSLHYILPDRHCS